jgi:inosine-uridine nucleoside N-ribohydrolase
MAATRLVIDCDPGIDDAIALLLALASPELSLQAVTAVGGNNGLDRTAPNALRILELAGRSDIAVSAGAGRPLVWPVEQRATSVHGEDGLGDAGLGDPAGSLDGGHAADVIGALDGVTLVAIGPLTNVALALARRPEAVHGIERLVWMGGGFSGGNVTPAAEFNAWWDPEAAARVLQAGMELVIVPLDATRDATVGPAEIARLAPEASAMLSYYLRFYHAAYGVEECRLHDPLAVAVLLDESIVELVDARVEIDCTRDISRGATLADRRGQTGPANARIAVAADTERFRALIANRLAVS